MHFIVWVRLSNHIADKLTVREPAVLEPLPEDEMVVYGYCLAPIEDRIYARCRILEVHLYFFKSALS